MATAKKKTTEPGIRDRIKDLRRVKASDLKDHPQNWRTHPDVQRRAVDGLLREVGFAGAIVAYEDEGGELVIIDGHLRAEQTGETEVPVLVTDLSEAEARLVLATFDPIGELAATADVELTELLKSVEAEDAAVQELLAMLASTTDTFIQPAPPEDFPDADTTKEADYCCPKCAYEWNGPPR
tara:strand:+ start:972 stop:1517 length:546 start_codon:yes stop_codon:yes gene_type:complete